MIVNAVFAPQPRGVPPSDTPARMATMGDAAVRGPRPTVLDSGPVKHLRGAVSNRGLCVSCRIARRARPVGDPCSGGREPGAIHARGGKAYVGPTSAP